MYVMQPEFTEYAMHPGAQRSESKVLRRLMMIMKTGTWMHAGVRKDIFSRERAVSSDRLQLDSA